MRTPWGSSDYQKQIAKGITRVSTPRHGGFYLSKERWAELMSIFPQFVSFAGNGWLEEDVDWAVLYAAWPELFSEDFYAEVNFPQALQSPQRYVKGIPAGYWTGERGRRFMAVVDRYHVKAEPVTQSANMDYELILANREF